MTYLQVYGSPLPLHQAFIYFYEHDRDWRQRFINALSREVTLQELQDTFTELADTDSYVSYDLEAISDQVQLFIPLMARRQLPNTALTCYPLTDTTVLIGRQLQEFHTSTTPLTTSLEYDFNMLTTRLATTVFELHKIPSLRDLTPQLYSLTLGL